MKLNSCGKLSKFDDELNSIPDNWFSVATPILTKSWGDIENLETYRLDKALEVAELVLARRNLKLTDIDKEILTTVFNLEVK